MSHQLLILLMRIFTFLFALVFSQVVYAYDLPSPSDLLAKYDKNQNGRLEEFNRELSKGAILEVETEMKACLLGDNNPSDIYTSLFLFWGKYHKDPTNLVKLLEFHFLSNKFDISLSIKDLEVALGLLDECLEE